MHQLTPLELGSFLEMAEEAAKLGGEVLKKYWGNLERIDNKEFVGDLVTEADKESEKVIVDFLTHNFPGHGIIAEEFGVYSSHGANYHWVIDPLDGTTNYTHQYPMVAVSIALLYKGLPQVGLVWNPILNELFRAARGVGSQLNGKSIHVSKTSSIQSSLLATGFAYDRRVNPDNNYAQFCHFTHESQGVRRSGAASLDLAYVAAGRLDGYWERGLKQWDIAAGAVLVEEAGGKVTDYNLSPLNLESGRVLATNGLIHEAMSTRL